jgi:hypothetical protein
MTEFSAVPAYNPNLEGGAKAWKKAGQDFE